MNNLTWMPAYLQLNMLNGMTQGASTDSNALSSTLQNTNQSSPFSLFEQLLLSSLTGSDASSQDLINSMGTTSAQTSDSEAGTTTPEDVLFGKLSSQSVQPSSLISASPLTSDKNYDSIISKAAETYQVDPKLIRSIIKHESNGNPLSTSAAGAQGLMQLMPATASSLGVTDAYNPEQNILGGTKYVKQLLDKFNGNTTLAVAAYNAGPGNVEKYNGVPPFNETRNYVQNVLGTYNA